MIRIPLSYNSINTVALSSILERYQGKHHNQITRDFEDQLAAVVGAKYAVALNSGTAAIHLALLAIGVKQNDVVVAPTFTYVATLNPVLYVGATPVLIDSERTTWNIDPELLRVSLQAQSKQGKLPKAIVIVHTYGTPACLNEIMETANQYEIPVIEDAAESLGATYQGKSVGTFGEIGIFSFNNNKAVTGFGGGAIVTNNSHLAAKARFLAAQAREDFQFYEHRNIGFNYGINPLAAAYALSQLVDIEKFTIKRKTLFKNYKQLAPDTFITQQELTGVSSGRWLSTFLLPEDADGVGMVAALKQAGIEARSVWKPMHQQPLLGTKPAYLNGNSDDFFKRGICLPSGNNLDEATQNEIISVMNRLLQRGY